MKYLLTILLLSILNQGTRAYADGGQARGVNGCLWVTNQNGQKEYLCTSTRPLPPASTAVCTFTTRDGDSFQATVNESGTEVDLVTMGAGWFLQVEANNSTTQYFTNRKERSAKGLPMSIEYRRYLDQNRVALMIKYDDGSSTIYDGPCEN